MSVVRVGIVEDNLLTTRILARLCQGDDRLEVVGTARNTDEAREMVKQHKPDVLTLDIDLPGTNGLTFLHNLMRLNRMPVVVVSSYVGVETSIELNSLSLGAVDALPKPPGQTSLSAYQSKLTDTLVLAANRTLEDSTSGQGETAPAELKAPDASLSSRASGVIAIGASTGGNAAIRSVLAELPDDLPPIIIAQHLPGTFARSFAQSLDWITPIYVLEACDGLTMHRGHAYCAPAEHHILIGPDNRLQLEPRSQDDENCPLVDRLFLSALEHFGTRAAGVLLTGMGRDGADGLLQMYNAGALTIAQNEVSSVVWGMPGAAVKMGAARHVLGIDEIAPSLAGYMVPFARDRSGLARGVGA